MKLLAATENPHKLQEIRRILEPLGITVLSAGQAGAQATKEETGQTFMENARIKAWDFFSQTGIPTLADDSGLCVDALEGRPGVYSARYGGEGLSHTAKIGLLLREMDGVAPAQRSARFVSAVCCILDTDTVLECEGVCEGSIGYRPVGEGGFGYDPIFMLEGRSYAQLTPAQKDAVSHRGRALEKLEQMLKQTLPGEKQ